MALTQRESVSNQREGMSIEREIQREIALPGGSFRFAMTLPSSTQLPQVASAEFVNATGSVACDVFELFGGKTEMNVAAGYTAGYRIPDALTGSREAIFLPKLATEQDVRTFLHEGGHFNQFRAPGFREVALIRVVFARALGSYRPLPELFEIAERFLALVPSLRGEYAKIRERYDGMDKTELEPPKADPEVIQKAEELQSLEAEQEAIEREREGVQKQIAVLCLESMRRTANKETLAMVKQASRVCEKVLLGVERDFVEFPVCDGVFNQEAARMEFLCMGAGETQQLNVSFEGEEAHVFTSAVQKISDLKVRKEVVRKALSEVKRFLGRFEEKNIQLLQRPYFTVAGSEEGDLPSDEELGTLSHFMRYSVVVLERDATERALAWMTQLRDGLGIDLLSHEGEDWYLTLECLGTYGADSSQLLEKLGFIPRIEPSAGLGGEASGPVV